MIGPDADGSAPLTALVTMIHVTEVERSAAFYRKFGLEIGNREPKDGEMQWAWLYAPKATSWKRGPNLMLTRSECPEGAPEEVVLYLYARDLVDLRNELMAAGVTCGEIEYPFYLPEGEFSTSDPDGYTVMIAQAGPDTP